ncbi:MAG: hypothetical protein ABIE68_01965 [bacterium]
MEKEKQKLEANASPNILIKEIVILAINTILLSAFWLILYFQFAKSKKLFYFASFDSLLDMFLILFSIFILLSTIGIVNILVKRKPWLALISYFIGSFSFLIFFGFNWFYLLGCFFLFVAFLAGYFRMRDETKIRKKIRITRIMKYGMTSIVTMLVLMVSLAYYFTSAQLSKEKELTVTPEQISSQSGPWDKYLSNYIDNFDSELTINEVLLTNVLENQSEEIFEEYKPDNVPPELVELFNNNGVDYYNLDELEKSVQNNEAVKNGFVKYMAERMDEINPTENKKLFGIEYKGNETVASLSSRIINEIAEKYLTPFQDYFPLALAAIFFFGLRFVAIVVMWISYGAAWLSLQILIKLKFIRLYLVDTKAEELTL